METYYNELKEKNYRELMFNLDLTSPKEVDELLAKSLDEIIDEVNEHDIRGVKNICEFLNCKPFEMLDLLARLDISYDIFYCWMDTYGKGYEYGSKYYKNKAITTYDEFIKELTIVLHKTLILYCKDA